MTDRELNIWNALRSHLSPMDEHYSGICGWVRDGIADGELTPEGIPTLVRRFKQVMAMHQANAEKQGTLKVDVSDEPSPFADVKPMRVSL